MTLSSRTSTSKVAISHPRFGWLIAAIVCIWRRLPVYCLLFMKYPWTVPITVSTSKHSPDRFQEPAFITSRYVCLTECASGSSRLTSLNMHIPHPPGQRHPSTWDRVILHHLEEVSYGGKSQTEVLESILFACSSSV